LREILERDQRDSTRAVGPLTIPPGAQVIDTTNLTEEQVIDRIVALARARQLAAGGVAV
jgi:cytidylate kinase